MADAPDIIVVRGDTFYRELLAINRRTGLPVDFSTYTARMRVRSGRNDYSPILTDLDSSIISAQGSLDFTDPGVIAITIAADTTRTYPGHTYYAVKVVQGAFELTLASGRFVLDRGVIQ